MLLLPGGGSLRGNGNAGEQPAEQVSSEHQVLTLRSLDSADVRAPEGDLVGRG
jgi:hypothetical protein